MTVTADTINSTELAALLNLSRRRVEQLASQGVLPRSSRGRYPRSEAVRGYIRYLQGAVPGKLDLQQERAALAASQRRKVDLEVATIEGKLLPAADVARGWQMLVANARARLLSLPPRLASTIAGRAHDYAAVEAAAKALVREALAELAEDREQLAAEADAATS